MTRWMLAALLAALLLGSAAAQGGGGGGGGGDRQGRGDDALAPSPAEAPQQQEGASPALASELLSPEAGGSESPSPAPPPTSDGSPTPSPTPVPAAAPTASSPAPAPPGDSPAPAPAAAPTASSPAPPPEPPAGGGNATPDDAPPPSPDASNEGSGGGANIAGGAVSPPAQAPPASPPMKTLLAPPPARPGGTNEFDVSPSPQVEALPSPEPQSPPAAKAPAPPPAGGGSNAADSPSPSPSPLALSPSPSPSPDPLPPSPSPPSRDPLPAPPPGDFAVADEDGGKAPAGAVGSPPPGSPSPDGPAMPPPEPSPDPPPSPAQPPPPDDNPQASALLVFKAGLSDSSQDLLEGWTSSTANPCDGWTGVVCDGANENVQGLQLPGLGLTGTISPSLASLPELQQVDLSDNQLAGVIPEPWQSGDGNAPTLQTLFLHNNWMTGPLPALTLRTLGNATLHGNMLTGSIPPSWGTAPPQASISILPQKQEAGKRLGGLCGAVPSAPNLALVAPPGAWYPVVNSLGSCQSSCNNPVTSLTNTNIFQAALDGNATVWDTAALNGWAGQQASAESVTIPCYQPGSPVKGYLGGDQAFQMVAWGDGASAGAGSVVIAKPGDPAACSTQGTFWSVDLRYNLTLAQVIIQAGPDGIDDVAVYLDGDLVEPGSGTPCTAAGVSLSNATATVSCAGITGRYLTLVSASRTAMNLCSVAVYPEVANSAVNRYYYFTTESGDVQAATNAAGSSHLVEASDGKSPMFVLDMGSDALVTAVSLDLIENLDTISVSTTNPLVPAGAAAAAPAPAAAGRRLAAAPLARHAQRALLQGNPAGVVLCTPGPQSEPTVSYYCPGGATGRYVVVTGVPGTTLRLDNLAAFLGQPPLAGPSPPPPPVAPAPPPPPPVRTFQTMWIGNLLVGGNLDRFQTTNPYDDEVLQTYNTAWSNALIQRGYAMQTNASFFTTLEKNVANPTGPPYYYGGNETGPNVYTNTSVSVDGRLSYQRLTELLDTPEVASAIATNLSGSWGLFDVWMLPYTSPSPPPQPSSGALSTGAIIGIAAGGAAAVVAAAVLLFCCVCRSDRRRARQSSAASKGSVEAAEAAQNMELGTLREQYPPPAPPGGKGGAASAQQLAEARKLYADQQRQAGDPTLPYGSAYANGSSSGAAQHSQQPSADSSGVLGGDGGALTSSNGAGASGSGGPIADDPLLEWILRTQSNTPQHAGRSAAMAAAAATAAATAAAAGDAAVLVEPRDGSSSARSTPKHSRGGSKALMDVRVWQFDFRDLEIQKQIGEGGFGRVYLAKWRETLVAVKVLLNTGVDIEDVDDAERALTLSNPVLEDLQKEASMMAALRHPNVVAFLGVCVSPPSVATEYCGRGSLTDVLRGGRANAAKAKQLDWARRINMALDAAKGMLYLHEHTPPIIHRDLKSPNLLVDKHWRVKVSDFNLSKIMEENSVMSSMAATNPRWLAPEILSGGKATLASDVWAFGIVLWELLTWDLPWGNTNPWQVVQIVGEGGRLEYPPRERLPGPDSATWRELDAYLALLDRCCAQTPTARPKFQEIIVVLRDMLERTLAAKGVLTGSGGSGSAAGTPFTDGLLGRASTSTSTAAATTAAAAAGARSGLAPSTSNASSLAAARGGSTPASPAAGGGLTLGALAAHDSEADTPVSAAAAYGSTLAELGSVGTLSPLGSQSVGGDGGRQA